MHVARQEALAGCSPTLITRTIHTELRFTDAHQTETESSATSILRGESRAQDRVNAKPGKRTRHCAGDSFSSGLRYGGAGSAGASAPGGCFVLASGFCDTLDGVLARNFQQASAFGGFLDSILDRYADAAVYAGVIIADSATRGWV